MNPLDRPQTNPPDWVLYGKPGEIPRWVAEQARFYTELWNRIGKKNRVSFHKEKLGPQAWTLVTDQKLWVWERPNEGWRVFVGKGGSHFEVYTNPEPTIDSIWKSWEAYKRAIGMV